MNTDNNKTMQEQLIKSLKESLLLISLGYMLADIIKALINL